MTSTDIDTQVTDLISVDRVILRMIELGTKPYRFMPELDLDSMDDPDDLYDPPQDNS
jgi:hypothetical protein